MKTLLSITTVLMFVLACAVLGEKMKPLFFIATVLFAVAVLGCEISPPLLTTSLLVFVIAVGLDYLR
jgi:hypothetical protein